jgi:hypothetical protein
MPVSVNWLIDNEIVFAYYHGKLTIDEFTTSLITMKQMVETSPRHLVHLISDVGDVTDSLPIGESLKVVRQLGPHPRTGWTLTLRETSTIIKLSSSLARSLLKVRTRTFDTLDEAIDHLTKFDPQINWEKMDKSVVASALLE